MTRRHTLRMRPGERGFTLMELLLATLVAAIVLAAMNTAFYAAMRLRSSTTALVENAIPMNHATAILKTDLRSVLVTGGTMAESFISPGTMIDSSQETLIDMYTTTGVIREDLPWGDLQRISYYLKNPAVASKGSGRELIRAVTRNLLAPVQPDVTEQVVLTGVSTVDFSFYDGTYWETWWDSTTSATPTPRAIKVEIRFASGNTDGQVLLPLQMVVPVDSQMGTNSDTSVQSMGGGA